MFICLKWIMRKDKRMTVIMLIKLKWHQSGFIYTQVRYFADRQMLTQKRASQQSGQLWFYGPIKYPLQIYINEENSISFYPSPSATSHLNFNRQCAHLCHSRRMLIHPPGRISGACLHIWEPSQSLHLPPFSLTDSLSLCLSTSMCICSTGV